MDCYEPESVRGVLFAASLRQRARDAEADATDLRERCKRLQARLTVFEAACLRAWGPTVLEALKATHPGLWPDPVQSQLDLMA